MLHKQDPTNIIHVTSTLNDFPATYIILTYSERGNAKQQILPPFTPLSLVSDG